ncbi:LacI family DNA-binding transcriptional regulator [Rubellimicrobium arenae]|uniref:LacI family DNA-binding transcriptional regulator n=1 Tax=Rubellimicrobium arenae TaxID=2817372 RepID=UPI001B3077EA|nr:LacI family DNA-binding transcriptional regulator [Rubellimicrobium arenae]
MPREVAGPRWKGPTVRDIAEVAGVGPATVDRVLNDRPGVRERTRRRVRAALDKLAAERQDGEQRLDIRLFCDSGESFNEVLAAAEAEINRSVSGAVVTGHYVPTSRLDPDAFARKLMEDGLRSDGVVLVAREHPAINRAVRRLRSEEVPVACLTTDLPNSRRSVYVGNDQHAAGSVAAQLIGRGLPPDRCRIMIVMSTSFRCQQEREMGFRRVLRAEYPHLRIEERVISDDQPETTFDQLSRYFDASGVPAAIYNLGGANRGVALALERSGRAGDAIFVGHELTPRSRQLLESGTMDYVISHDIEAELATAARWIRESRSGRWTEPPPSQILIHTRYNCGL